jgi:hypothetical protein
VVEQRSSGCVVVVAPAVDVVVDEALEGATTASGPEHALSAPANANGARTSRRTPAMVARNVTDVASLTPTCVWRATPQLIVALDARFGEPVDAYLNGSQVWLRDDGPGGTAIEWRLHPVAGYQRPTSVDTYELFSTTAQALAAGGDVPASLDALWDGLEAFPAYGDELEPALLAAAASHAIGAPPDATGLVDHESIGREWERTARRTSIVDALFAQLRG